MRNLSLKLISLICGISLFLFVNYFFSANEEGTRVVQLNAPIEVLNAPANKALIWPAMKQVEITLQGSALFMSKVTLSPPVIKVNLHNFATNKYVAKLSADDIELPATVRLLAIKPTELEFGSDPIVESLSKIVVPQIGNLPEDLKLTSIEIVPTEVKVVGPSRELQEVSQIETVPLNLSQLKQSTELELDLRNPGILSQLEDKKVKLKISLEDATGELSFLNLPVRIDADDSVLTKENLQKLQKTVNVKLSGTKKTLRRIKRDSVIPYVTITDKNSLTQPLDVTLDMDQELSSVQISPAKLIFAAETPTIVKKINSATRAKKTSER